MYKNMSKFFFILPIFLMFSCPEDFVKQTVWRGSYTNSISKVECKMELVFTSESDVVCYLEKEMNRDTYIKIIGSYTISDTYTFSAKFKDSGYYDNDASKDAVDLEIEGELNYLTNKGNGSFEINIKWGMGGVYSTKGDWELFKSF